MHQLKVLSAGLVLSVVAVSATLALPHVYKEKLITTDFLGAAGDCEPEESPSPEATETPKDDGSEDADCEEADDGDEGSDPEEGEESDADDEDAGDGAADNHGQVVKIAAHCDVKGRAHGALVSSIARDKDVTAEDAEKACEEAMATLKAGDTVTKGKPEKNKPEKQRPDHVGGKSHGKPEHAKGNDKDASDDEQESQDTDDGADSDGSDNGSSSQGNANGKAKDK